jgi:undecaprenyl-diphosphatase
VQGITEFFPVSSSAHLVLAPWWFGWSIPKDFVVVFSTTLHLGTIFAVILFFYRDLWAIIVAWLQSLFYPSARTTEAYLGWWIILGTIPAALAGVLWQGFFESVFSAPVAVAALLLVTGMILALTERYTERWRNLSDILWVDALLIGIAQAFAILPGISRSGATISAGLWRGIEREQAARFSFLLSVPIIVGTGLKELLDLAQHPVADGPGGPVLLIGVLASAIAGYFAIHYLLKYLQHGVLYPFAVYCWAAGLASLVAATIIWP